MNGVKRKKIGGDDDVAGDDDDDDDDDDGGRVIPKKVSHKKVKYFVRGRCVRCLSKSCSSFRDKQYNKFGEL